MANVFSRIGRGLAVLTGADAVAATVRGTAQNAADFNAHLRRGYRAAIRAGKTAPAIPDHVSDETERFRVAAGFYGVSARDLPSIERGIWQRFAAWFGSLVGVSAFAIATNNTTPLLFTPFMAACAVRVAFWHWQIRTRRLGSFGAWLAQPGEWWPPSSTATGRGVAAVLAMTAAAGLALLVPGVAEAATTAQPQTIAEKLLAAVASVDGATVNPFAQALGVMSKMLVGVGAGVLCAHTLIGTAATAHSGKVLGEHWHSMWGPLRVVVGMGMLVPMPSGFSAVHGVGYAVPYYGNKMASDTWATFVDTVANAGDDGASVSEFGLPVSVGGLDATKRILELETCRESMRAYHAGSRTYTQRTSFGGPYVVPPMPDAGGEAKSKVQLWDYGRCGSFSIPTVTSPAAAATFSADRIAALKAIVEGVRNSGLPADMAAANLPGNRTVTWPENLVEPLNGVATGYETAMRAAARKFLKTRDADKRKAVTDAATRDGWIGAGAYWRSMADMSGQVITLAGESPTWAGQQVKRWLPDDSADHAVKTLTLLDQQWTREATTPRVNGQDLSYFGDSNTDALNQILAPMTKKIQGALDAMTTDARDPMRSLMTLGHVMLGAGESAIVGGAVIAAATGNGVANLTGAGAAWQWISNWAMVAISGDIVAGFTLAYVLPMLPFIAVLWLAVGWIVFLVEAMIALPVWAFMFVRLDGQQFIDHVQKPGFILLFNLFLRPTLGILGLCGAYYALPLAMGILNYWFAPAFVGQQGGHFIGVAGLLGGIGMLVYLQYQVAVRVLALVHQVPDRVSRWFGASAEGLGEEQHTSTTVGAVVGGARTTGTQAGYVLDPRGSGAKPKTGGSGEGNDEGGSEGGGVSKLNPAAFSAQQASSTEARNTPVKSTTSTDDTAS